MFCWCQWGGSPNLHPAFCCSFFTSVKLKTHCGSTNQQTTLPALSIEKLQMNNFRPTHQASVTVFHIVSHFGKASRRRRWNRVVFVVNTAGAVIYSTCERLIYQKTKGKKATHQNVALVPHRDPHLFIYLRVSFYGFTVRILLLQLCFPTGYLAVKKFPIVVSLPFCTSVRAPGCWQKKRHAQTDWLTLQAVVTQLVCTLALRLVTLTPPKLRKKGIWQLTKMKL